MLFIHSNKKYRERTMYPINPFINTPAVVPLTMEAFVAPANFDPDAQELNIVKAFAAYPDVNKKYIFSVGTSATTVLPAVTGRSYAYSENGGGYTTVASGTITWTIGSTKRNVIVIDQTDSVSITPIQLNNSTGAVWVYIGDVDIYGLDCGNNEYIKYIHFNSILNLKNIRLGYYAQCYNLTGIVKIPSSISTLSFGDGSLFQNCTNILSVELPSNINYLPPLMFMGCVNLKSINLDSINSIDYSVFNGCRNLEIQIPNFDNYLKIGSNSFQGCSKIFGNVIIPNSDIIISGSAFYNCTKITSITFNKIIEHIPSLFIGMDNIYNLVSGLIDIKDGIKYIDYAAFARCRFTRINLPQSILGFGDYVFVDCNLVSRIDCLAINAPSGSINMFSGMSFNTCIVHVPIGSLSSYRSNNSWNQFTNIIDDL